MIARVQTGTSAYSNVMAQIRTLSVSLTSAATAGNVVVATFAVDKSSGTITPPSGWEVLANQPGTSVSLLVVGKVAAGGEQTVTVNWSTNQSHAAAVVVEYSGVNTSTPFGPSHLPAYSDTAVSSLTLNPAAATSAGAAVAVLANDSNGGTFAPTAAGFTTAALAPDAGNSGTPGLAVLDDLDIASGEDIAPTFALGTSDQAQGYIVLLNGSGGGGGGPTPGTTVNRVLGAVTASTVTAVYKLANTTTARLAVATDAAFTNVVAYSAEVTPDARGVARMTATGLAADTGYYCRVESNGTLLSTHQGSFRTFPDAALTVGQSKAFAFASCYDKEDSSGGVFDDMRATHPDFFLALGDFPYLDYTSSDQGQFRSGWDGLLARSTVNAAAAEIPFVYTWSDHDFGINGSHAGSATNAPANTVYREKWPHYPIPATSGIYQAFTWGPDVRVIVLDGRSFRSNPTNTDGTSKTMLGTTQKQWLKDQITNATEPVIFIASEVGWIGDTESGEDHWGMYQTERNELAAHFTASGKADRIFIVCGDMHGLAYDDGTNAAAGVRVFHAAPLGRDSNAGVKGGPYSSGSPIMGDWENGQFGLVTVGRTADGYTVQFDGINQSGSTVLTTTQTVAAEPEPPAGPTWTLWNGTSEQPLTATVWNGTTEVAATAEVV